MPLIILFMHTKLTALILGCLLLFVTPIMGQDSDNEADGATHLARIIVPRAIVYSDENMNSPLGYISNDRLVTVGNPRKKNPDLVPLVVYGRLAFIESKNLSYENESMEMQASKRGAPKEHNIDLVLVKPEDKLSENNSVYLDLHQFGAGEGVKDVFQAIDGEDKSSLQGIGLTLLHRKPNSRMLWGAGFEYSSVSTSNIALKAYLMRAILGYTPFRSQLFLVDIDGALDILPSTQLTINNNFENEPNGFAYGPSVHARIVFFPENTYHLFGTMGIRSYKVDRLDSFTDANGNAVTGITKMTGVNIGIGLAIEL